MNDKELSIRDIRCIGGGRYSRKLSKSPVFWGLMLTAFALLISCLVVSIKDDYNPQYTLPSGEIVELDRGNLITEQSVIVERDNPSPPMVLEWTLLIIALCIFAPSLVYMSIQEDRARDKIMEEWLADGYQPKATDV